jgi:hypothetical protein
MGCAGVFWRPHRPRARARGDAGGLAFFLLLFRGAQPCGGWSSSTIARLQGFSSCSPAAFPHQWSSRRMTTSLVVGGRKSGCGFPPALSFKDVHHPRWGGRRAKLGFCLPHGPVARFFLQHSGEERGSPATRRRRTSATRGRPGADADSCSVPGFLTRMALAPPPTVWSGHGCPSSARAMVASCAGRQRPRPFPCRRPHRGIVEDVVRRRAVFAS